MRKSKHALVLAVLIPLIALTGCTGQGKEVGQESESVLKAYTLEEALELCETLPESQVNDCVAAALNTPWGE